MDLGIFVLRVVLGVIFIAHGSQKLFGAFSGPGISGVEGMLKNMGFFAPLFWAWALSVTEALGGLLVLLGVLPRTSAAFIAIAMLVALVKVHLPKGLFMSQGGFEYLLLILAACIMIVLAGGGKFSLYDKF